MVISVRHHDARWSPPLFPLCRAWIGINSALLMCRFSTAPLPEGLGGGVLLGGNFRGANVRRGKVVDQGLERFARDNRSPARLFRDQGTISDFDVNSRPRETGPFDGASYRKAAL